MTAKMPMSGSPEKRRDCITQLPLRSPIFRLALNYITTLIRLRQRLRNWGDAPLPCLLTRGQAPSTNAAREGKHVLPNSFYGNGGTKFPKTAEPRLRLGSSSPARTAIWNKQPRSRDYSAFRMRAEDAALQHETQIPMVPCGKG